ncbi:MAG: polyprenyl synthetase family protein [Acidobacteria bacterium]|nr:polyprenyl synthetase family protein [Acidobacteriota bacterium]MBV9474579.1 polyprenyl synthetase family protein [Acidobacteriota bacterium]
MTGPRTLNGQTAYADRILDLIAPKLELVEEELRRNFFSKIATIRDVGEHILGGGGKRLRPALLLLVSKMLRYEGRRDIVYGAVVEFIHTATLIHDDIIDEADVRRGRTSVNYGWGNNLTVLVGDYIFMHSMHMALGEGNLDILRLLSDATIKMIEGEILGTEQNGRTDLSIEDYFSIVSRKTAALFGATCRIPAYLVELPESQAAALFNYGYNLGITFQLIDDLLDFTSSTEVLGKPALSDLKEGKVTLPLILAAPHASARERELIARVAARKSFDGLDPAEVLAIAERYDTIEQTREIARDYAHRARIALEPFGASAAKETLELALDFVLERDR